MARKDRSRLETRPDTRDADATGVLIGALPDQLPGGRWLVIGDRTDRVADALAARGAEVQRWSRMALRNQKGTPWPPPGPFVGATLRLPRSKPALEMTAQVAAAVLEDGGELWLYGANDEGIKSAGKRLAPAFEEISAVDARRHCRVLVGRRAPAATCPVPADLDAWGDQVELEIAGQQRAWTRFPGVFARGQLDPGTRALLDAQPPLRDRASVLDFACGIGIIGGTLLSRHPSIRLQMLDADAVAARAARVNVPGAMVLCGDGWSGLPAHSRYDRILSNPPIHTGKGRDYSVLTSLVEGSPARLLPDGTLWLVVQRQIPLRDMLYASFDVVDVAWEDTRFRVWSAGRLPT